jgi:hypothetical protein
MDDLKAVRTQCGSSVCNDGQGELFASFLSIPSAELFSLPHSQTLPFCFPPLPRLRELTAWTSLFRRTRRPATSRLFCSIASSNGLFSFPISSSASPSLPTVDVQPAVLFVVRGEAERLVADPDEKMDEVELPSRPASAESGKDGEVVNEAKKLLEAVPLFRYVWIVVLVSTVRLSLPSLERARKEKVEFLSDALFASLDRLAYSRSSTDTSATL